MVEIARQGSNRVAEHLWMGSAPPVGSAVRDGGFHALVLAAAEYQPSGLFPGVEVFRVPLDDARPSARQAQMARMAASSVADRVRAGRRVLVTCFMGLNRSGLITALALVELGVPPDRAVELVREARPGALGTSCASSRRRAHSSRWPWAPSFSSTPTTDPCGDADP